MIDGIYNIKGRSTLHALVANYTNKDVTCNKGQCIGHIELFIDHMPQTSINNLNTQKMIEEHVQPDNFTLPLHNFPGDVMKSLDQLLETSKLQFAQDETSVGTSHLTKMQIDMGDSEPVSQKPHLIAMKLYNWVRSEINKPLDAQVICSRHSNWSETYHCCAQGRWWKMPSN